MNFTFTAAKPKSVPSIPGYYFAKYRAIDDMDIVRLVIDDEGTAYVLRLGDENGYAPDEFAHWGDKIEVPE